MFGFTNRSRCSAGLAACAALALQGCAEQPAPTPPPTAEEPPAAAAPAEAGAPGDHVSFFVIGKSWHFDQTPSGALNLIDLGYFAEIFKIAGGEVSDAFMRLDAPGSEPIPFDREGDGGAVLYGMSGQRHGSVADLDAELPNGDYAFSFSTPGGDIENFAVTVSGEGGVTDLPPGPVISLSQNGEPVAPYAVQPGVDVLVSWTPFDTGRADPNGISDDLIFVMMSDCNGERAYHSGRPLGTPNPLEPEKPSDTTLYYDTSEIVIPGEAWVPGMRYTLDVEHARLLDTDKREGVVGMSTYAVTTHLDVRTMGEPASGACPPEDDG
jgi:hypothetical protein